MFLRKKKNCCGLLQVVFVVVAISILVFGTKTVPMSKGRSVDDVFEINEDDIITPNARGPNDWPEWIIPWNRVLSQDSTGYCVQLRAWSCRGDSTGVLTLRGERPMKRSLVTRRIVVQLISIVVLLSLYLVLYVRTRGTARRRTALQPGKEAKEE